MLNKKNMKRWNDKKLLNEMQARDNRAIEALNELTVLMAEASQRGLEAQCWNISMRKWAAP